MYQDTTGNMFLVNSSYAGTDLNGASGSLIESINVTAITGNGYDGLYKDVLQDFTCYVSGTLIATPYGDVPIETLKIGDMVQTADRGAQSIVWIGDSSVQGTGRMAPVRIRAGALGANAPRRDQYVSQQYRMLVNSKIVKRMTGKPEVLVAAKKLTALPGIEIFRTFGRVRYLHILLDQHSIIFAEATASESLLLGPEALKMLGQEACDEIHEIFPSLAEEIPTPARAIVEGPKQKNLIRRHRQNERAPCVTAEYNSADSLQAS